MPKTHWDGLLFSEAGTPRGLFGSSRRVLPSPSSPSSSSLFIFSLYSNQISPFTSPVFFGVRETVAATIQRVILAKEPSSKEPWRQNLGGLRTCTHTVWSMTACDPADGKIHPTLRFKNKLLLVAKSHSIPQLLTAKTVPTHKDQKHLVLHSGEFSEVSADT